MCIGGAIDKQACSCYIVIVKARFALKQVTPLVVWGPTVGKRDRQASCLDGAGSSLPTKQRTTLMGRSERGLKDQHVTVSILRRPKRL